MYPLRIVHLSDLHLSGQTDYETDGLLRRLLLDLRQRISDDKLDDVIVVISGDLTFSGKPEEFKHVEGFCRELRDLVKPAGIYVCPGNHDLDWGKHPRSNVELMDDLCQRGGEGIARVNARFASARDRANLREGMSNYYSFLRRMGIPYSDYLYSLQSFVKERFKINFIALNSAYLWSKAAAFYGFLGTPQIEHATGMADQIGDLPNDFRVFNVSFFHHPFEAIAPCSQLETETLIKSRSDLILTGHVHNLKVFVDLTTSFLGAHNTRSHPLISGARCVFDEVRDPSIVPGYSIIEVGLEGSDIQNIKIYEIRYDKAKRLWFHDPNNPNYPFVIPVPISGAWSGTAGNIPQLHVASMEEVRKMGWNSDDLYDRLRKLDFETLEGLTEDFEFSRAQASAIRGNHPETFRVLIEPPDRLVGCWTFVPLFPEWYQRAVDGELRDSDITLEKVPLFELGGRFKMYFLMIQLEERFRRTEAIHVLYDSFLRVLESLAQEGVFFEEICTNAWSPQGEAVCRTFGMQYLRDHKVHGKVFVRKLFPLPNHPAFKEHPKLIELYNKEFASEEPSHPSG